MHTILHTIYAQIYTNLVNFSNFLTCADPYNVSVFPVNGAGKGETVSLMVTADSKEGIYI